MRYPSFLSKENYEKIMSEGGIHIHLKSSVMYSFQRIDGEKIFVKRNGRMWEAVYEYDGRLRGNHLRLVKNSRGIIHLYRDPTWGMRPCWIKFHGDGMRPNAVITIIAGLPANERVFVQ